MIYRQPGQQFTNNFGSGGVSGGAQGGSGVGRTGFPTMGNRPAPPSSGGLNQFSGGTSLGAYGQQGGPSPGGVPKGGSGGAGIQNSFGPGGATTPWWQQSGGSFAGGGYQAPNQANAATAAAQQQQNQLPASAPPPPQSGNQTGGPGMQWSGGQFVPTSGIQDTTNTQGAGSQLGANGQQNYKNWGWSSPSDQNGMQASNSWMQGAPGVGMQGGLQTGAGTPNAQTGAFTMPNQNPGGFQGGPGDTGLAQQSFGNPGGMPMPGGQMFPGGNASGQLPSASGGGDQVATPGGSRTGGVAQPWWQQNAVNRPG